MKTIHIELPEDVAQQLSLIDENHQKFILEAIREKIKKKEAAEALKKELKEGYQATYEEDLDLTSDFESADLEDWKRVIIPKEEIFTGPTLTQRLAVK